jgi:hypothetical protein
MAEIKHFYAFKLKSDYTGKELKSFYAENPQTFRPVRKKNDLQYVGVEFSEKIDDEVDDRNAGRLKELVADGWILFEHPSKAAAFLNQEPDSEEAEPVEYTPTKEELGE